MIYVVIYTYLSYNNLILTFSGQVIDIRDFADVVKLRDQISSRYGIKLHTEKNYKWPSKQVLPMLNRDEALSVTLCTPSTEPRQEQAGIHSYIRRTW